jgi:4-hydroxy-tetrahydrodipicolinate reductase
VAVATRDLDLGFMRIDEGNVAGLKNRWLGISDGAEVIELGSVWKMTEHVEPNWEIRHGWHFEIDGMPTVKMHVAGWPPAGETNSEVLMSLAMVMTAMPTVHAIPHVVAARPGVVTYKDLPLVAAAGHVRT